MVGGMEENRDLRWVDLPRETGEFVVGAPGQTPLKGWNNVGYASGPNMPALLSIEEQWRANVLRDSFFLQNQVGRLAPQHREWRFNASIAYGFQTGRLKNARVGLSARYRGASVIGYVSEYASFGPNQVLAADLKQPIYAPEEWFFDGFVSYRGRLPWKDLRYRLQLNVQNLLNENDIYPNYADSFGRPVRYAQFAGRSGMFTAAIEF